MTVKGATAVKLTKQAFTAEDVDSTQAPKQQQERQMMKTLISELRQAVKQADSQKEEIQLQAKQQVERHQAALAMVQGQAKSLEEVLLAYRIALK